MALVTAEVTWLRWLLKDFGVSVSLLTPVLSDSTGAISIARDPVKHDLTKHVGVDAHFTQSQVQDGVVAPQCVPLKHQWQISSQRLRLAIIINFTSPNIVLLIHHEFEGGIRYVLAFLLLYFFRGSLYILPPPVYVYIWALGPQMNTSAIHNRCEECFSPWHSL
jgi:hypothetical protein